MKFEDCAKPTLGERGARALFDTIQKLERISARLLISASFPTSNRAVNAA